MEEKKVIIDIFSKIMVLLGILSFVSYFVVRMYAISGDGAGDFYGVRLLMPDRLILIIFVSTFLIISGCIINALNNKSTKSKQV